MRSGILDFPIAVNHSCSNKNQLNTVFLIHKTMSIHFQQQNQLNHFIEQDPACKISLLSLNHMIQTFDIW